jgi:CubicO group peptidase (beta-lactamase class C family)
MKINLSIFSPFKLGSPLLIVLLFLMIQPAASREDNNMLDKVLMSKRSQLGGNVCLLVYRNGKIILERHLGNYTRNTIEPIASCSKWFTAALAMTYFDNGLISADDTIGKYLPVFTKFHKGYITIRQCLSHTTGIESEQINFRVLLERRKYNSLTEEVNDFVKKPLVGEPGKVFGYGNIGLNIVGRIMEIVSGKDFESIFQERIAKPLEMKNTTFSKGKAVNPSGGAYSTASDYMNFLSMILNNGVYKGKRIISQEAIKEMQISRTAGLKIIYTPAEAKGYEYGYGEWILEKDKNGASNVLSSPGLFGTFPYIDKARNYAAIIFVKNLQFRNRRTIDHDIIQAINQFIK